MDRRSKPPNPRKGRSGSNCGKRLIPLLGYEDELVPGGGPAIRSLQKEGTAIEIRRKREHSHTRYSPRDPLRSLQPPHETHLKEAVHPSDSGGINLPGPRERPPQADLAPYVLPTMGELWEKQDEKLEKIKNETSA